MTTSPTFAFYKPRDGERVPLGTLGFARAKFRNDLYHLILRAFRRSGISQAELSMRLDKDAGTINRNLGAPGNWTLETVSDLLFAINGNFVAISEADLISMPIDQSTPDWLEDTTEASQKSSNVVDFRKPRSETASVGHEFKLTSAK